MSLILMNILAYLAIIALIGLIAVCACGVSTVLAMIRKVKSTPALIDRPRQSVEQIIGICKGSYLKTKGRALGIASNTTAAVGSVVGARDEIMAVAGTVDIAGISNAARGTADSLRGGSEAARLVEQILKTIREADFGRRGDDIRS
jgi:hypothetical protein